MLLKGKILVFLLLFPALYMRAQDPHFHETGGFGTGNNFGLDGEVYRVTTLANEGEGSLRSFLEMPGPRLVVFEVGGIIDLEETDLRINNGQLTVAGQTAPYPGITLINGSLRIAAEEVLIQHLAIRPGDRGYSEPVGWEPDGVSITGGKVVMDHCSVSWSVDENMSVARGGNNVTFYRCIISEGLSNSIHAKGEHSCGSLVTFDTKNISIIGCLYAHNYRRHPRYADGAEMLFANNVIYNYGIYASHVGANPGAGDPDDPGMGDFIGNAYFKGVDGWDDIMLEIHRGDFDKTNPPAVGMAYWEDNLGLDRVTGNALLPYDEYVTILETPYVKPEAFTAHSAYENIEQVLKHAGARPGERSEVDARVVASLIEGTGSVIDSQSEVGGYPVYTDSLRAIENIPPGAEERRTWLDSISASMEAAEDLDVSGLYTFIDEHLPSSLRQGSTLSFQCYAPPGSEYIILTITQESPDRCRVSLLDMAGRILLTEQDLEGSTVTGKHKLSLKGLDLPNGIYLLTLSDGERFASEKILIRK